MTLKEQYKKVDLLKAQLEKLQPLKSQDEQRLWKKFRLEWNFNSNHMEGNTLTYVHTELLLIFDKVSGDYTGREIEEMKAHDVAIKMVLELAQDKERDLSESFIRQLNQIILVRSFWKEAETLDGQKTRREITPGEYKRHPNSVRLENGEMFNYATPEETPAMMGDLMNFYKKHISDKSIHPVWLAAMMHYKFVRIHPFDDGNGRVARLIMNYVLFKNDYPPVIIKESGKKAYLMALNKADTGDVEAFVTYIGQQLNWSLELSVKAANGENIEEPDDIDKKVSLLNRKHSSSKKIVLKSEKVVKDTIRAVYLDFLIQVDLELRRFNILFETHSWAKKSDATDNLTRAIRPYQDEKLANIIKGFSDKTENDEESGYGAKYTLKRFNKEDDSFNANMVCDITFEAKYFGIKVFVGDDEIVGSLTRMLSRLSEQTSAYDNREISFAKNRYNDVFDKDTIKGWARKVADRMIEYIDKHAAELEQRRKNI